MDELQQLAVDLQLTVMREVTGHDAISAWEWVDDLVEEAFMEVPRPLYLRIFLDEVQKRASRSREILDKIEAIKKLLA